MIYALKKKSTRRLFLDVTRVIDGRLVHTGISRYGRELIKHLSCASEDEVWAFVKRTPVELKTVCPDTVIEILDLVQGRMIIEDAISSPTSALTAIKPLSVSDVVHSIHLPLPSAKTTGPAARVLTVHDVMHLRRPDLYEALGTPPIKQSIDSLTPDDTVICPSEHARTDFLAITNHRADLAITVPMGCNLAPPFVPAARRTDITCLVQLASRKNSNSVLAAITQVLRLQHHRCQPHTVAHIFTPSARVAAVHDAVDSSGADYSRINIVTDANDEEINAGLAKSRAFVWGSVYEGYGLPILEAMAHGVVPVLAPNTSHIGVAGDSGAYAPSADADSLARVLYQVLNDSEYAEELSARAIKRARQLSWRNTANCTLAAYERARRVAQGRIDPTESSFIQHARLITTWRELIFSPNSCDQI